MRKVLKWLGRIALALVLATAVIGVWKRAEIARLYGVVTLFDAPNIVQNFSHMDDLFFHAPMSRGDGPVSPLPQGAAYDLPQGVQDWIVARSITGLVILQGGELRLSMVDPPRLGRWRIYRDRHLWPIHLYQSAVERGECGGSWI